MCSKWSNQPSRYHQYSRHFPCIKPSPYRSTRRATRLGGSGADRYRRLRPQRPGMRTGSRVLGDRLMWSEKRCKEQYWLGRFPSSSSPSVHPYLVGSAAGLSVGRFCSSLRESHETTPVILTRCRRSSRQVSIQEEQCGSDAADNWSYR